ncbi:hypothetical protein ACFL4G_03505 [Thermodesulfobacteriota bacterium]
MKIAVATVIIAAICLPNMVSAESLSSGRATLVIRKTDQETISIPVEEVASIFILKGRGGVGQELLPPPAKVLKEAKKYYEGSPWFIQSPRFASGGNYVTINDIKMNGVEIKTATVELAVEGIVTDTSSARAQGMAVNHDGRLDFGVTEMGWEILSKPSSNAIRHVVRGPARRPPQ